jgi:hypothetical protein
MLLFYNMQCNTDLDDSGIKNYTLNLIWSLGNGQAVMGLLDESTMKYI